MHYKRKQTTLYLEICTIAAISVHKQFKFVDAEVHSVVSGGQPRPKLNEYVLVENYIPGNMTKWCNKCGYRLLHSLSKTAPFKLLRCAVYSYVIFFFC